MPDMIRTSKRLLGAAMTRAAIALVFAAAFAAPAAAKNFAAAAGAPSLSFPKPDRPVADIVSPIWHDEKERDAAGEPDQLVRLLGIEPGMTVADVGAGSGYYVARLSPVVSPGGRIFAEDVVPEYLRSLRKRVGDLGLNNVTINRGEPHDPRLPPASVDIAILVHMYHEIAQPYGLLYNLVPALKPDARVGIVDAFGPSPSMVLRRAFSNASSPPSAIARSGSIVSQAAMLISQCLRRRRLQAARARKRLLHARRAEASCPRQARA
jgi:SAM-dependent methyltransferase